MKKLSFVYLLILSLVFFGCTPKTKKADTQRLQQILSNTSVLSVDDANEALDIFEAMIDQYQSMSKGERETFLKSKEGEVFAESYLAAIFYFGARYDQGGKIEGVEPLTSGQREKLAMIMKKIEKDPLQIVDLDSLEDNYSEE